MSEQNDKPTKKIYYDNRSVAKRTEQLIHLVEQHDKAAMLEHIINKNDNLQTVIITKSKRRADELGTYLKNQNINAITIHGNHRTEQYETAAAAFNAGEIKILITTDMILGSLNLTNIQLLISYDLPSQSENYFIRLSYLKELGKSIALVSPDEQGILDTIEFVLKIEIPEEDVENFTPTLSASVSKTLKSIKDKKKKPRHRTQKVKKSE